MSNDVPIRKDWLRQIVDALQSADLLSFKVDGAMRDRFRRVGSPQTALEQLVLHCLFREFACNTLPAALRSVVKTRLDQTVKDIGGKSESAGHGSASRSRDSLLAQNAKIIIDKEYTHNSGTTALAQRLGAHRNRLSRVFLEEFGVSIREYRTAVRIAEAASQLHIGEEKVETVAHSVGFKSRSAFSMRYHELMGLSPEDAKRH